MLDFFFKQSFFVAIVILCKTNFPMELDKVYYTVLYCIVLLCIVLYCIVLYCIVLYGDFEASFQPITTKNFNIKIKHRKTYMYNT